MIHIEFTIGRRHLIGLAGLLVAAVLLIPGVSWASNQFTDVPDTNVFHSNIAWLADADVTKGCNPPANDEFCPGDAVTREQMAAFMQRLYNEKIAPIEALLAGVSRNGDTLLFDGMNIQLVNGAGTTATTNSLGNLIIGYNADNGDTRTGSHMLVVGDENSYTSYGGIIAGLNNATSGEWSSVTGGRDNTASGTWSSVTGGLNNTASGFYSLVSGGQDNEASGSRSSVSGGEDNTASDRYSSVSGGQDNTARNFWSSVSGGVGNTANGDWSSVSGGSDNSANGDGSSVSGGADNTASGNWSTVGGGAAVGCGGLFAFCSP